MEQNSERLHGAALADMLMEATNREIALRKVLYAANEKIAELEKDLAAMKEVHAPAEEVVYAEPIN